MKSSKTFKQFQLGYGLKRETKLKKNWFQTLAQLQKSKDLNKAPSFKNPETSFLTMEKAVSFLKPQLSQISNQ